ncbi:DUF1684 domain-containing protein [Brevibacterium yomogidense]|uniref:DUF1684 domain-containing protein n=1 Tax=Brevibacterium yomogidense TaxID=946573 RepID=A0A1X6WTV0_9MICO|nr:DUF1684 domain-containing protein [Brevibacterium yomogidense]SLM88596.1 hypothetical protein FM105_00635 [Brevibacterium yomogidense]
MEQFTSEWQAWHDDRLAALATPFGFLSITGLHWLQQGENTWEGAPGSFDLDGDTIRFRIGTGRSAGPTRAALEAEGAQDAVGGPDTVAPARGDADSHANGALRTTLGTDRSGTPWIRLAKDAALSWLVADHTAYEAINRDGRIGVRVRDSKSALLSNFVDIPAFPLKRSAVVPGVFVPYSEPRSRRIATALPGLEMDQQTLGTLTFEFGGATHTLTATGSLQTGLTVDFQDRTNGDTTPMWRTLSVGLPDPDGVVTLDFNRTVVYPFAFMPWATCPAPVRENILSVAVRAGEQSPTRTISEDGVSHPVGLIAMSDGFPLPEVLDWLDDSGTELFRHRLRRSTTVPGPMAASAFIVFGMKDIDGHADDASVAAVREFAGDALAVGTPVIGIGTSGAEIVFDAAREQMGSTGQHTSFDTSPMPVVVSADVAEDRMLRGCVTMCPEADMGIIDIEALAAEIGDDTDTRRRVWTDLIDRFTRLVITRG